MQPSAVTNNELSNILHKLKNEYTSGADDIPTSIVKLSLNKVLNVVRYILNNSLRYRIFPEQLKIANIKPLLKNKGSVDDFNSYRPISLLPSFSKIFAMVMCSRNYGIY